MKNAALHYTLSIMTIMAKEYQTFEIERVLPPKKFMLIGNASETTSQNENYLVKSNYTQSNGN